MSEKLSDKKIKQREHGKGKQKNRQAQVEIKIFYSLYILWGFGFVAQFFQVFYALIVFAVKWKSDSGNHCEYYSGFVAEVCFFPLFCFYGVPKFWNAIIGPIWLINSRELLQSGKAEI